MIDKINKSQKIIYDKNAHVAEEGETVVKYLGNMTAKQIAEMKRWMDKIDIKNKRGWKGENSHV